MPAQLAGITRPASMTTMSPGTMSSEASSRGEPSRTTTHQGAESLLRASSAFSAFDSWMTPTTAWYVSTARMITASEDLAEEDGNRGRSHEDVDQDVLELFEQPTEEPLALFCGEAIRRNREPTRRLRRIEADGGIDRERRDRLRHRPDVPLSHHASSPMRPSRRSRFAAGEVLPAVSDGRGQKTSRHFPGSPRVVPHVSKPPIVFSFGARLRRRRLHAPIGPSRKRPSGSPRAAPGFRSSSARAGEVERSSSPVEPQPPARPTHIESDPVTNTRFQRSRCASRTPHVRLPLRHRRARRYAARAHPGGGLSADATAVLVFRQTDILSLIVRSASKYTRHHGMAELPSSALLLAGRPGKAASAAPANSSDSPPRP